MPYLGMVEWLEHYWEQLQVQFLVSIVLISNGGKKRRNKSLSGCLFVGFKFYIELLL